MEELENNTQVGFNSPQEDLNLRLEILTQKVNEQAMEIQNLKNSVKVYKTVLDQTSMNSKEILYEIHNNQVHRNELRLISGKIQILEEFLKICR
jgi:hypothetical protein